MNILAIAIIIVLILIIVISTKRKEFTTTSLKYEIKPNIGNGLLTIILFVLALNPIAQGFPFDAYRFSLSLGFGSGPSYIIWHGLIFDLLFWYIFSCFIFFLLNSKKNAYKKTSIEK